LLSITKYEEKLKAKKCSITISWTKTSISRQHQRQVFATGENARC